MAALTFPPELLLMAQGRRLGLKAAIFDVDGVLTDGRLFIGENGESFKAFSSLDGQGLKLLAQGGITPLLITGRDSPAVRRRVTDLGLPHALYGVQDKLAAASALLQSLALDWPDVAMMGDDWPDLPLLTRAGFACAPANAHAEVRAVTWCAIARTSAWALAGAQANAARVINGRSGQSSPITATSPQSSASVCSNALAAASLSCAP